MTSGGGTDFEGTIYKITSAGALTTLYSFCYPGTCNVGAVPYGALMQSTNGQLYGETSSGGANYEGSIFSLNVGLGPFVESLPSFGKVGAKIRILGTNLKTTTAVSFNGVAATFSVLSNTQVEATVPTGATTGKVKVTTSKRTFTSNVSFRVLP